MDEMVEGWVNLYEEEIYKSYLKKYIRMLKAKKGEIIQH